MAFKILKKLPHKTPDADPYLLSLDIGTEFVKALICQVEGADAKVIGVGRQHQGLSDMQGGAITDIAGVVANCDAAIKQAEEMSGVVARNVVIGIAGELVKGTSTTIKYKRSNSSTPIDMDELRKILNQVQERAFERARSQLAWETGYNEIEVKLVNSAIVDVEIDGYRVTNPIGFQGRDVSIQLFCAFAPMVHLGAYQTVASNLDLNLINIAAEPFAVAKSVGQQDSSEFSAIFIDIGGGTTDIALVNNGGVEGTKMFAIGGRSFTRRIAQVLDVPYEKAEQLKLAYSAGELGPKQTALVQEALGGDIEVWLSGVELSLAEFDKVDHLPAKIMLCGGGTGLPEIAAALKRSDWYKNLPFARKPVVSYIDPNEVAHVKDSTGKLTSHADITAMGLANLGLDMVQSGSPSASVLERLSRVLQS